MSRSPLPKLCIAPISSWLGRGGKRGWECLAQISLVTKLAADVASAQFFEKTHHLFKLGHGGRNLGAADEPHNRACCIQCSSRPGALGGLLAMSESVAVRAAAWTFSTRPTSRFPDPERQMCNIFHSFLQAANIWFDPPHFLGRSRQYGLFLPKRARSPPPFG